MLYRSEGILRYSILPDYGYRLVAEVGQGIADYYRSLIPKWIDTTRQRYAAHISIVRKQVPSTLNAWGQYEGASIDFWYSNLICTDSVYFWLNLYSPDIKKIRGELGLPVYPRYHLTIANIKA